MATFGAPISSGNDFQNDVNASIEIVEFLSKKCESGEITHTKNGIGLHSGPIVTGNVGSSERKQFSIFDNTVILASRIEQLKKKFGSAFLLSREVVDRLDENHLKIKYLGSERLKGRAKPREILRMV